MKVSLNIKNRFFSVKPAKARPSSVVREDFLRIGVGCSGECIKKLSRYPDETYDHFLKVTEDANRRFPFRNVVVDEFSGINSYDFIRYITSDFLIECVIGDTLKLTSLSSKIANLKRRERISKEPQEFFDTDSLPVRPEPRKLVEQRKSGIIPHDLLTPDFLYRSKQNPMFGKEYPFPSNREEYQEMMGVITQDSGIFPGDHIGLENYPDYFSGISNVGREPARVMPLRRGGNNFKVVVLNPKIHAPHLENRIVFDLDVLAQVADWMTYGKLGSWPRKDYHENRWFKSTHLAMAFSNGMPVSFAAATPFETTFSGQNITSAFIHGAMTRKAFQSLGISSFLMRQILLSIWWKNIYDNKKMNLVVDPKTGNIENKRFQMWIMAHSGRFPIFRLAHNTLLMDKGEIIGNDFILRQNLVAEADRAIYGERVERPLEYASPNIFRDVAVYQPKNRAVDGNGKAIILEEEVRKDPDLFQEYLEAVGGTDGIENGNAFYLIARFSPMVSIYTKYLEWQREMRLFGERTGAKGLAKLAGG